ncbi:ABC transporter substrate-binding protein [Verrucomicrobiota bacterium]
MRRSRRSPLLVGLIVAAAAAAWVILCLGPKKGQPSKPSLVVLSRLWSVPHEKAFVLNEIIAPFEVEHGCRVDFQTLDDDALLKRARVQQASGRVSTDVVIAYVSRMREWVEQDHVIDLSATVDGWKDRTFAEGFSDLTVFDGGRFFLPICADDYLLCANIKALQYLPEGADPATLTWAQLADWALAVREGEGEGKFAFTCVAQQMLIYQIGCAVLSYGGRFPEIGSPEAMKVWELFVRMKEAFAPTVRTYDSVVPPMKRGEAWLTVSHNARVGEIYASNPTQFLIGPPPLGPAGRGSIVGFSGLGICAGCPSRDLAVSFLEYLTRPEVQLELARGTGGFVPTVSEATALLGESREDEVIRHAIGVLEDGILAYIPPHRDWGAVKLVVDEAFHKVVFDEGRIDEAYLRSAQGRLDRLLAEADKPSP